MKKILIFILIFVLTITTTFAYNPSKKDINILNKLYVKIGNIIEKVPSKVGIIQSRISELKEDYKNNERFFYMFSEIEKFITDKLNDTITYSVLSVADGDTITVSDGSNKLKIRMIGIDAPESSKSRYGYIECYGKEAGEYLRNLLDGKEVKIEYDITQGKTDRYGRTLSYIHFNGENINNKLIKEGYAWEYLYNKEYKYIIEFQASQKYAENNNLGLWNTCNGERLPLEENIEYNSASEYQCGTKTYCSQMNSCEEAQFYLNSCNLDRLDRDGDGIPCEAICN